MFERISRLASTLADYTVGTLIVVFHLAVVDRNKRREPVPPRKRLATVDGH